MTTTAYSLTMKDLDSMSRHIQDSIINFIESDIHTWLDNNGTVDAVPFKEISKVLLNARIKKVTYEDTDLGLKQFFE